MSQFSTYLEIIQEMKKYDFTKEEEPLDTRDLSETLGNKLSRAFGFSFFAIQIFLSILFFDAIHFNKLESNRKILANNIINYINNNENLKKELKKVNPDKEKIEQILKNNPIPELTSRDKN